jgi:amino acid adenylation domain-containing protein
LQAGSPLMGKVEFGGSGRTDPVTSASWEDYLSEIPALELPTDRPRPATLQSAMSVEACNLPPGMRDGLARLSLELGVEAATVGLAAFSTLIYRYTSQEKFAVAMGPAIGQRLPVLADFSDCPSFRALLRRLDKSIHTSRKMGPLPSGLTEPANGEPAGGRHPIYRVAFSADVGKPSGMDLCLDLADSQLRLHYNVDLFEPETAKRMRDHVVRLLAGAIEDAQRPVSDLPMLSEAELQQQCVEWNSTGRNYPQRCLHQFVELVAAERPSGIAVVDAQRQLSYDELNSRANQVAHDLQKRGVGRGARVAICLNRSTDFAVALLGVLKSGAACVPLDPSYPEERLALMLADIAAPLVFTEDGFLQGPVPANTKVVYFSQQQELFAQEPRTNPEVAVPTDIAYVIYTSGSTGKPRGVLLHHAGLVNYSFAAAELYEMGRADRMLQFCSISFDAALEEIFTTWAAGATLVFRDDEISLEPGEFLDWAAKQRITVVDLPTAYWHEWVYALPTLSPKVPPSLRLVIVGGEKASPQAFSTWHKFVGNRVRWVNTYGPAEASICATSYEPKMQPGDEAPAVLPIGRPFANTRVYLLDQHLNPVPVGAAGELHIGGVGVAQGYLNLPELTAEKFIADPFSQVSGARMYKTGDLARYLPNGDLEFVGRRDNQVKIRGFRVEPGEIESVLLKYPGVHDAAVILREDAQGNKRLVSYVVRERQDSPRESELREHVKRCLPPYMVPSEFIFLAAMPLTPNGKVNRRALPNPDFDAPSVETRSATAENPLQAQLIQIWEELLGRRPIGIRDNFFELGGHSLLAARMMYRVKQLCGSMPPLAMLLQAPTIEQLAALLSSNHWSRNWSSLVPMQPAGSRPPFFCVHGVGGNVVGFHELSQEMKPDYPFYGLQSLGLDGNHACHKRIEEMASHYLNEIRSVQAGGPYHLGGFSLGGLVAYEMASQLAARGEQVGLLVLFDTYAGKLKSANHSLMKVLFHPSWSQIQQLPAAFGKKIRRTFRMWRLPADLKKVMRSNAAAADQYQLQPYRGKATLLRAESWRVSHDAYAGWQQLVATLETIEIQGAHMDILREPHVARVAECLKSCIDQSQARDSELDASTIC